MEIEPNKKIEDVELKVVNNEENKKDNIELEVVDTKKEDFSDKTIVVETIKDIDEYRENSEKSTKEDKPVDNFAQNEEKVEETHVKNPRRRVNLEEELFKIDSNITYEYSKIVGNLDYSKIKSYKVVDDEKTISFLFYENDFYAVNRINFKDGYMYSEKEDFLPVAENLNKTIRKIPNVAKARNILHIENIEARIYDMTEYILLLEREKVRIIKVSATGNLSEMNYQEYNIDKEKLEAEVDRLAVEEEIRIREENSIKNRLKELKNTFKKCVVNPIKNVLAKMGLVNDVKMLSDGKHSIFEKKL